MSLAKSGVGVRQLQGGGVDPFVPLQVSANDTPKRAVFNEDTLFTLNDESKQSDLAVLAVVDAVEIRPENIDAIHGQPFGHAFQHPAGRGVHYGHHDAAVSLVFLLLETHNCAFGPGQFAEDFEVLAEPERTDRKDIVSGAALDEITHFVFGNFRMVFCGKRNRPFHACGLLGIADVELGLLPKFKGVDGQRGVVGGVNFG